MRYLVVLITVICSNFNLFSQNLSWNPVNLSIGKNITHIIPISESRILFKSENGTFIVTDLTDIKRIDDLLPDTVEITSLAVDSKGTIYAGTNNVGVLTFSLSDNLWKNISYNLESKKIDAIAVSNENEICIISSIKSNNTTLTSILKNKEESWFSFKSSNLSNIKYINYNDLGEIFAFNGSILTKVPNIYHDYDWERIDKYFEINNEQITDFKMFKNEHYISTKYNRAKYYSTTAHTWISLYEGIENYSNFSSLLITEKAELLLFSDSNGVYYSENVYSPFEKNNIGLNSYKVTSSSVLKDGKILICTDSTNLFISNPPKGLPITPTKWTDKGKYSERKTSTNGIDFIKFSNDGKKIFTFSGSYLKIWDVETGILIDQKVFLNDNFISASVSKDDKSILLTYLTRSDIGNGNYTVSTEIFNAENYEFIKKFEYLEPIYYGCSNPYGYHIIKSEAEYIKEKEVLFINFTYSSNCDGSAQIGSYYGKLTKVEFLKDTTIINILFNKPISNFLYTKDSSLIILSDTYSYFYYHNYMTNEQTNRTVIRKDKYLTFDTISLRKINDNDNPDFAPISKIDYIEKSNSLAGRANNKLYIWNLDNLSLMDSVIFPVKNVKEPITYMFSNNFRKIIAALNNGIYIYSFPDMRVLDSTIFKYETGYNWKIAVSPDSSSFAVGSYDGMLRLFKSDILSKVEDNYTLESNKTDLNYVYPNPSSDFINFVNKGLEPGNIELFSIEGMKLSGKYSTGEQNILLDISGFYKGLYYIKFQNRMYKFVKI